MNDQMVLPVAFDVLHAAIDECFASKITWVYSTPVMRQTSSSVAYDIILAMAGAVGEIRIRKVGEKSSELTILGPKSLDFSQEISHEEKEMWAKMGFPDFPNDYFEATSEDAFQEELAEFYKGQRQDFHIFVGDLITCLKKSNIDLTNTKTATKRRKGPNLSTIEKLSRLAHLRDENIRKYGEPLGWYKTCGRVPVARKTVTKHLPQLREKWEDKAFRLGDIEELIQNLRETWGI